MNEVKEALEQLAKDGLLKPSAVVEAARDSSSPLHSHFEWDDSEAAEKWRQEQARQLIRSITITVDRGEPVQVRAYVSLPADRENGNGYRRIEDVMSNEFMRKQLAGEISDTIQCWEKKAAALGVLFDLAPVKTAAKRLAS